MTHSNPAGQTPARRIRAILALLVSVASFGCAKTAVTTAGFGSDAGDASVVGDAGDASVVGDAGAVSSWPDGKYLSVDKVHDRVRNVDPDMQLINVVDEEYYSLGHIANSRKIPWDVLAENLSGIDKGRPVVLYCRKGVRSESAYETLMGKGYSLVWIMQGGVEAWIAAGYPTVAE